MPTSTQKGRNMEIEIKSTQILENNKETILQKGNAKIEQHIKGTMITWKTREDNITYQMTILENKIILKKSNQTMIFEKGKTTNSNLQTPYGTINMKITTNHMEIEKGDNQLKKVILDYQIELENTTPYQNQIEIRMFV